MKRNLYILHELGAPRHFEALFHWNKLNKEYDRIIMVEFRFIRQFFKGIVRRKPYFIKRAIRNLYFLIPFLFTRHKEIIVGAAPYDVIIYYLLLLKKRHQLIYYSSWPYWDQSKYPKKIYFPKQVSKWEKFLSDIKAVGVTQFVKDGILKYTDKVTVIPHCVNEQIFYPNATRPDSTFRIIYAGRMVPEKGIHDILQVIDEFSDIPSLEWWFIGDGPLKAQIKEKEKTHRVKCFEHTSDAKQLASLFSQSHVLLLPSKTTSIWEELFGIVLIEAMACGAIPITTNAVGPRSIIEHLHDGFIIPEQGVESIKSAITLIIQNREKFHQMSQRAQGKVMDHYTINRTSQLWGQVLSSEY